MAGLAAEVRAACGRSFGVRGNAALKIIPCVRDYWLFIAPIVFARLTKMIALSMILMGVLLSAGAPASLALDHCSEVCTTDCGESTPASHPEDHHDDDCPTDPHHHHGVCIHTATAAWLVEWDSVLLNGTSRLCGRMVAGNEYAPDDLVFALDKPPLI